MRHIESLDGVRALAIGLVVLFHAGFAPFGWVGVQLFFVLSGYLITRILIEAKSSANFDYFGRFYWRRSLRIFPLYLFYIAATLSSYGLSGIPASFSSDWPWLLTYTTNFARMKQNDVGEPFVHLWSLAVEEQFYLLWPFVIYKTTRKAFGVVVIAILATAPLVRLAILLSADTSDADWLGRTIYGFSLSQFDAFAAGAAIYLWPLRRPLLWFAAALLLAGLAGAAVIGHQHLAYHAAIKWSLGYAMYLLQDGGVVWGYSILNVVFACLIAVAIKTPPGWLSAWPLKRTGVISYGLYVYHVPLLIVLSWIKLDPWLLVICYSVALLVLAEASYRWIETPFLKLKDRHFVSRQRIV